MFDIDAYMNKDNPYEREEKIEGDYGELEDNEYCKTQ